jgi:transglutaminase-like putative cysteine protease
MAIILAGIIYMFKFVGVPLEIMADSGVIGCCRPSGMTPPRVTAMTFLQVRHSTIYRYASPVRLGQHRLMLRPRDSHDLRLVGAELMLSPPGGLRWMHDVFGNSVALVDFSQSTAELSIVSTLALERFALVRPKFPLDPSAELYPFVYSPSDRTDLGRLLEQHYPDPHEIVDQWAKRFAAERPCNTLDLLATMNAAIREEFAYNVRYAEGTQPPIETIEMRSGSCRDFALLFIEAARCLGFGARFVSGYLYDPALDGGAAMQGAGATHAWAEVYLPGAGWVEYDPTNGIIAGENLIRVAVTRDASQAVPISGSFTGRPSDFLGMQVDVTVTAKIYANGEGAPNVQPDGPAEPNLSAGAKDKMTANGVEMAPLDQ